MAREQKLALGYSDLYGHGLQTGQALRNIVLDPSNSKAYDNLRAARQSYDQAYGEVSSVAGGTSLDASNRTLAELRARQGAAQEEVLDLANVDRAAAIAALNAKETPAWRALRAEVMKLGEASRKQAADAQASALQDATRFKRVAIALAAVAAFVAAAFLWSSQRTVRRELGGDPRDAGAVLRRIASGETFPGTFRAHPTRQA